MSRLFRSLLPLLLLAFSCASPSPGGSDRSNEARPPTPGASAPALPDTLSFEEAHARARQIQRPTYNLWLGLDAEHSDFEGRAVINFDLRNKAKDFGKTLFLEFEQGTIRSLAINGTRVERPDYDGYRIRLRLADLQPGTNRLELSFSRPYSGSAPGLHRFKDPQDGEVYVYSDLEPYAAHKVFPCFDQPDLKASFELTVEAPEGWQVVSNTVEREVVTVGGRKSWAFPPSPLLSPYVFAIHAGPFKSWKASAEGIPLRLLSRKSIAAHVYAEDWLRVTRQGLDYFAVQFGYPYPYAKYDQLIVPEFSHGGMENAAAVTFSEKFVFRSPPPRDARRRRAETILHEMAHMWFGNLVTMRWWNGLWLNESFASLLAAQALTDATEFKDGWEDFTGMKRWAYWEDQLPTSHPVETPVANTAFAETHFDGIAYGKGAAVLRQLRFLLGADDFREGIQRYILKYALRSTSIHDFFKMLSEASGQDLARWEKSWLHTHGTNSLRADWACEDGRISRFSLIQGGPAELKTHKTRVGLYRFPRGSRAGGSTLRLYETLELTYSQAQTPIAAALRKPCPDFVLPNQDDLDYALTELDPVSLRTAQTELSRISDDLARELTWNSLWQMTLDAKLGARDFAELAFRNLPSEKNTRLLSSVLSRLHDPSPSWDSVTRFLPETERAAFARKLDAFLLRNLERAPAGTDLQLAWFERFTEAASSPEGLALLRSWIAGQRKLRGLALDQDRRWAVVRTLARAARTPEEAATARELIQREFRKDPGDRGIASAITCDAAIAYPENKKKWLSRILAALERGPADAQPPRPASDSSEDVPAAPPPDPSYEDGPLGLHKLRSALRAMNLLGQEDWMREVFPTYFELLPKLADGSQPELARAFANSLFPFLCEATSTERAGQTLASHPTLPPGVVRALKIQKSQEERCVRARAAIR
ncbi:MAG: aminopeptidase N [Oligoflexia bacterium]|nr:aminopeptidase N [Oligoflexia bacterium]